jgi:uncharacterized membrane protein
MTPLAFWHPLSRIGDIGIPLLFVGWLLAWIQAGRGKLFKLPIVGQLAKHLSYKIEPPTA